MADNEKDILEEEMKTAEEDLENLEEEVTEAEKEPSEEESSDAEDAAETSGEPKTWAEKMAAKKQAKQDKKSDGYKEKISELEDRAKRQLAEFENFRRRSEKEKQAMLIDNFERGLAMVPEDKKEDPFVDGMNRIYKQMLTELDNIGVKPIDAVGKEFDPNLHNAVMQVESDQYEAGVVAQELQKGYTYHDSVVRHSMVAVVSE